METMQPILVTTTRPMLCLIVGTLVRVEIPEGEDLICTRVDEGGLAHFQRAAGPPVVTMAEYAADKVRNFKA